MSEEGGGWGNVFQGPLGRIIIGIIKLILAPFIIQLATFFRNFGDVQIGQLVLPVGSIISIILAFLPIFLLISALRDLGIKIF